MAYTVDDGAILEVSFRMRQAEQRCISLFHYRFDNTTGPVDGPTLINTIDGLINVNAAGKLLKNYADTCVAALSFEEIVYQWLHPTRRPRVVKTPVILAGQVVDDPAPVNIAFTITKRTDVAGRKGVGSLHMPGGGLNGLNGSEWTIVQAGLYGNLLVRIHEVINVEFGQNLTPVLLHRAAPAESPTITSATGNLTVRTMHRRTVGVGE